MDFCILCGLSKKDDIRYGEFLKKKGIGLHTFCLYCSANLSQKGDDDKGFLGFLTKDIKEESRRASLLKCCYCNKSYANIGCCAQKCRRSFHFICGLENGAENIFCKDFASYCHKHARQATERAPPTETCLICFESLSVPRGKCDSVVPILAPCCRNGWFHKFCLQKFAKTAGYFFKCPLCNDDKVFREKLPLKGIFIPNQDAAWELEPNAFAELLERPNECAAQQCKNRGGRKAKSDRNPFIMCHTCGSAAIHKRCLSYVGKRFDCSECCAALEECDSGRESINSNANQVDDVYIDVCNVSDREDLEIVNRLIGASSTMTEHHNKRDSGTNNDSEMSEGETPSKPIEHRRQRKSSETDKPMSEANSDDIKPCTSKRSLRLRLKSVSPETLPETQRSSSKTRLGSGEIINGHKLENRRVSDELDNGKICKSKMLEVVKRKSLSVFNDSDSDHSELVIINPVQAIVGAQNSENSDQEEVIRRTNRKRKGLHIFSESEDEIFSPEPKRLIDKNFKETVQNNSHHLNNTSDESDDDDPLDNFFVMMEKKFKAGIAQQTPESDNKSSDTGHNSRRTRNKSNNSNKSGNLVDVNDTDVASKQQNNLDVPCVALRTRREFVCGGSNNRTTEKQQNHNENRLNASCIALRTRRKTICGRIDFSKQIEIEKSHTYHYGLSQVNEKIHESNENIELLTDSDDRSRSKQEKRSSEISSNSDLDHFIVDGGYEERDRNFDISCIANRTRRRSLKFQRLSDIVEISDSNSDSSMTWESLDKRSSARRLRRRRFSSTSSEEIVTPAATLPRASALNLEKVPLQNFTATFTTNTTKDRKCSKSKRTFNHYPNVFPRTRRHKRII